MDGNSTTSRPQRKRTKPIYVDEESPSESDEGAEEAKQRVNKSKSKARKSKGKGKARAPAASSDDDELDSSRSEAEQPRKKRKKASKNQRKNKKGKGVQQPELLSSLPVELFAEIFDHCSPADLLALSKTSKTFRSLLSSPNSASLWKAARRSVGLPDLTAGKMTEVQYAHLVFSTRCQSCGKGNTQNADYFIRKRLCKTCRAQDWVKLSQIKRKHPELHPHVDQICLYTNHSASSPKWESREQMRYASLSDLKVLSEQLFDLGAVVEGAEIKVEEDEHEALMRELLEDDELSLAAPRGASSTRTRQSRAPDKYVGDSARSWSSAAASATGDAGADSDSEEVDGDEEDDEASAQASALADFVKERKELRTAARKDGEVLRKAVVALEIKMAEQKESCKWQDERVGMDRCSAIEDKVLALEEGYTRADFKGAWFTSKIVNAPVPLTDEDWDTTVKAKVIKLLARIKTQQAKIDTVNEQRKRQKHLRPRYWKLFRLEPTEQARHVFPLFVDFLQLDSVKPVWEPEDADPEDDDAWAENLDAILEELDDYRISVRLEAVQTILSATTEMSEEELNGDADEFGAENGYDDDWLARPVSFLVCNIPGCRVERKYRFRYVEARPTFFGSLPDLLAHQHAEHANLTLTEKQHRQRQEQGIVGHFHLPPLVVSALSAVISFSGVDDAEATLADVDGVTSNGELGAGVERYYNYLRHENPAGYKKYHSSWRDLIEECIKQSEKAAKSKRVLEVPEIVLHEHGSREAGSESVAGGSPISEVEVDDSDDE